MTYIHRQPEPDPLLQRYQEEVKRLWPTPSLSSITAATTATNHLVYICDATSGAFTLTLPAAAMNTGRVYHIKRTNSGANAVTIDGNASETIDGATTYVLAGQYQEATLYCDGTNWHVIGAFGSGLYTPTLTNVANIDSSVAFECQWMRVGNVVTVGGRVNVDPTTTATSTQLGISLPIASAFVGASQEECCGTAFSVVTAGQGAAIIGDATNDRAQMQWVATDTITIGMWFTFTYIIK